MKRSKEEQIALSITQRTFSKDTETVRRKTLRKYGETSESSTASKEKESRETL
jgi:hypothetical protein